jgi:hypothetical protein
VYIILNHILLKISGLFQKGSTDPQDSSVRHARTDVDDSTSPVQVELLKGELFLSWWLIAAIFEPLCRNRCGTLLDC